MLDMANCIFSGWSEEEVNRVDTSFVVPCPPQGEFHGYPSRPPVGFEERRGASSSKSHRQAEQRRRDRINAQLATLRKLIPTSHKMEKAALLGSVVEHVKELKREALEVSKMFTVPTEVDEVTIVDCDSTKENTFIKASLCCDDRPELFAELSCALGGLSLTTVQADMTCLGGRIKVIFVVCTKEGVGMNLNSLKQSLKVVLSRFVTFSTVSNYRVQSKRQRFFLPSNCSY